MISAKRPGTENHQYLYEHAHVSPSKKTSEQLSEYEAA